MDGFDVERSLDQCSLGPVRYRPGGRAPEVALLAPPLLDRGVIDTRGLGDRLERERRGYPQVVGLPIAEDPPPGQIDQSSEELALGTFEEAG